MNATLTGVRLGLARGRIELRQHFTYPPELAQQLFFVMLSAVVLLVLRGRPVPGTDFSLEARASCRACSG